MFAYYVTQKSNMASKMAANTKWPQVHNYSLKFDDVDVYPQVFGSKEHIKTNLDITELFNH